VNEPLVIAENLGKQYSRRAAPRSWHTWLQPVGAVPDNGKFWGLRDVSFTVRGGEMLGVIGANGAGKSTLLRLLGGIGRPTQGRLEVKGRIGALLDLGGGFLGDLTGRENAILAGVVAGLLRTEIEALLPRIIAFAELEEAIDDLLLTYSSGMTMRLAFSVAVHTSPNVLLVDEFLSVGDLAFQARCRERIAELRHGGCAIVFVSHTMEQVRELCDRTLWLRRGETAAFDTTEVVTRVYESEMHRTTLARTPAAPVVLSAAGIELVPQDNRMGTLEAEVTKVTLLPGNTIRSGEPLALQIDIVAHKPISQPIVTVSITRSEDGAICLDTSTARAGVALGNLASRLSLNFVLDRLEIQAGSYFVNVGVFEASWAHAYDYHWHAYPLYVEGAPAHNGVLAPPTRWLLLESS